MSIRKHSEAQIISWFRNLFEARVKVENWRKEYNQARLHSSLGYQTPEEFAAGAAAALASPPHAGGNSQDRGE